MTTKKEAPLLLAILPIIVLIVLLTLNVLLFDDTLSGANQIALMLAAALAGLIAYRLGYSWNNMSHKIVATIGSAMPSILILLLIGSLAGTWLISGVIPAMIYYGVALLGIGKAIGIDEAVVAGAIISGAYFGDKMSPLSDTTNLAPAMAGTDLFTHIRYMMYTTVPTMIITLVIFLVIGFRYDFSTATIDVANVKSAIEGTFSTNPLLFLVPVILFAVIIMKVPPLPALFIGTILGGIFAIIFQPHIIREVSHHIERYSTASYYAVMQAMFGDVALITPDEDVNELLSTSGMRGMLDTVWLILSAMVFGGIMESAGLLKRITQHCTGSPGTNVPQSLRRKRAETRIAKPHAGRQRNGNFSAHSVEYLRRYPIAGTGS